MPFADVDGVKIFYEDRGDGPVIVFAHEFCGDYRSWDLQVRHFSASYRCIAFNARGYPPSDVPNEVTAYSQERTTDDIASILRHLGIANAHVVGLSMGAGAALNFSLKYPAMARSIVVCGGGSGSLPTHRAAFLEAMESTARLLETEGMAAAAKRLSMAPNRIQYLNKDPDGWQDFSLHLAEHSAQGSALTLRGGPMARRSWLDLGDELKGVQTPTLILTGDEDDLCLEPSIFLKRTIQTAGLWVFPRTGHTINREEPELFNDICSEFFQAVDAGSWGRRDPRAIVRGL